MARLDGNLCSKCHRGDGVGMLAPERMAPATDNASPLDPTGRGSLLHCSGGSSCPLPLGDASMSGVGHRLFRRPPQRRGIANERPRGSHGDGGTGDTGPQAGGLG